MNKTKLVKQIDQLAANVAKKGIFVVTKHHDYFAVQEHITKKIVVQDLPLKNLAEYLCQLKNKGTALSITSNRKLNDLVNEYFKLKNDIMFYNNTLRLTANNDRFHIAEDRLHDAVCRLEHVKYKLKKLR